MSSPATFRQIGERFLYQVQPPDSSRGGLREDVYHTLMRTPRSLSPKYFYDAVGSDLFDRICDTPEYYLTRDEESLLARISQDVIGRARPQYLIEFGSGAARKIRYFLDACSLEGCCSTYVPIDVCGEVLMESGRTLTTDYEWLKVMAIEGDYAAGLAHFPALSGGARLFLFLGSTIGNYTPEECRRFLERLRSSMGKGDRLLLGADRVKDPAILHAAYNDAGGVTAEFNLNVLQVLNRELQADFQTQAFYHYACYNPVARQIEMYLVARRAHHVHLSLLQTAIDFQEGEAIQTEISRKFTGEDLTTLLAEGGFTLEDHFELDNKAFSLLLAYPEGP